ncbi:hypothetical protein [Pseudomonas aeruginosa]|uniref:hypothetical protein n=1 Tax=Pseudomonas aeruginosa TaxID=287 RepID=UPI001589EE4A|nr:hypothetical protein [Pseudomonas aeruginosa]EIU2598513.1 hypothetical protein [Pseudomonas aeruginosa]EIU2879813.1 hypothetical protein [Pseudomonas aeruginosa]ELC7283630.1 hypothetical protein [Pseudomonas aeruginosa]ELK4865854.1 hypothetical protein [Pseudomonas aeruginosa]ELN9531487.1 hypothetical protein [Pseudomonas aeruginosa]
MARKPAHLQMTGTRTPRQTIWESLRHLHQAGETVSTYAIARHSQQDDETVRSYLLALARAEIVRKVRNLPQRNAEWELLDDRGAEAPAITKNGTPGTLGRGCENIWRALRILGEVSAEEAAASASAGGVTISAEGARVYLQGLNLAGYVTRNGGTASNPARYRLIPSRNTGPRHPVYQRSNYAQVYDPNLGEIVWSKGQQSGEPDGLRLEVAHLRHLLSRLTPFAGPTTPAELLAEVREVIQ